MSTKKKALAGIGADKKKLGMMLGLLAVGLLLWGRLLLKQVPRSAVAEPAAETAVEPSAGGAPAGASAATIGPRVTVPINLPKEPGRDLFTFDSSRYARVPHPEKAPRDDFAGGALATVILSEMAGPKESGEPGEPTKSEPETPDVAQRVNAARRAAVGMVLQSTIMGDRPRAVINGTTVAPGQRIKGFEVKSVLPRRVVLELNGVEVYLDL